MKIYLKALGYVCTGVLGLTLILTLFHYFNLIGDTAVNVIKLIITILSVGVGGFIVGESCAKKGWLEGIKLSLIVILIIFLITIIFGLGLDIKNLIYYFIIMISSTIGSMIGISTKEKK